jgi:cobalamin biosynthesis protein CobT
MINAKQIVRSLPLVASVLGKRYGVKVIIGGDSAYTDGATIHLPSLPFDSDEKLLGLVRGYIDHESAHIRATDFEVLRDSALTPLTKHIWNILEDWRVENSIAQRFPGCQSNLHWLIRDQFSALHKPEANPATELVNYILYVVRAWDVVEVGANRDLLANVLRKTYPALLGMIDRVLAEAKSQCACSRDCMTYAQRIVALIASELQNRERPNPKKNKQKGGKKRKGESPTKPGNKGESEGSKANSQAENALHNLRKLLNADSAELPRDFGKSVAAELGFGSSGPDGRFNVAIESPKRAQPLPESDLLAIRKASSALHARLHALLQSSTLTRSTPARRGKLDARRLYRISSSPKLFLRHGEKQGISTLVHLLLDCSGSMRMRIGLATQSCYAIAHSLSQINGISLGVTAFPSKSTTESPFTVCPLLKHEQRLHTRFQVDASGTTPMGEALWWVMQEIQARQENRKIILIVTDGRPDSTSAAQQAIKHGQALGFEFYGLGIEHDYIKKLLPDTSESITQLDDLVPTLFKLLRQTLMVEHHAK